MIYLFEDKLGRMEKYIQEPLENESLKCVIMNCAREELDDYIDKNFPSADAVLFHKSYTFPKSDLTNDLVCDAFIRRRIPFVYFSGGSQNNLSRTNDILTADVRSEDMYLHIPDFLREYKETNQVNIPLLVYGEGYLMNSLLKLMEWITSFLWTHNQSQPLNIIDAQRVKVGINSRMQEEELQADKDAIRAYIDENIKTKTLTPGGLIKKIQELIDKY